MKMTAGQLRALGADIAANVPDFAEGEFETECIPNGQSVKLTFVNTKPFEWIELDFVIEKDGTVTHGKAT